MKSLRSNVRLPWRAQLVWFALGPLVLLAVVCFPPLAAAHLETVSGSYRFEIGWRSEPVIIGEPNGVDVWVFRTSQREAAPTPDPASGVRGAEAVLKVEVEYADIRQTYALQAVGDQPGHYSAGFIPSREGQYTFHLSGAINGEAIDVRAQPEAAVAADQLAFPDSVVSAASLAIQLAEARERMRTAQLIAIAALAVGLVGAGAGIYGLARTRGGHP